MRVSFRAVVPPQQVFDPARGMSSPPFRFTTLGRLTLVGPAGEIDDLVKRRRKLALLAVLALAKRPIARHVLVDLFWGEEPEERARHSLSDALSHLRRVLGRDAVASLRNEVALAANGTLAVDAIELAQAAERGDHVAVVAMYGGPFLNGVYVDRSPGFDQWVSRERARLERLFLAACEAQCAALSGRPATGPKVRRLPNVGSTRRRTRSTLDYIY